MRHTFKVLTKEEIMANRSSAYKFVSMETKNLLVNKIRALHEGRINIAKELNETREALRQESPFKKGEKVLYGKEVCYIGHVDFSIEKDSFYFVYNLNKVKKDGSMSKKVKYNYIKIRELCHYEDGLNHCEDE